LNQNGALGNLNGALGRGLCVAAALTVLLAGYLAAQAVNMDREGVIELDTSRLGPKLGEPLEGEALEEATARVATKMRCPVCQGMPISASPSAMAVAMKEQVRELLSLGYTEDQVWNYFEGSYGEFVRLEPKREGLNWLVWLVPPIAIVLGALLVVVFQRSQTKDVAAADPSSQEQLGRLLDQVRKETRTP